MEGKRRKKKGKKIVRHGNLDSVTNINGYQLPWHGVHFTRDSDRFIYKSAICCLKGA